jgi:gephyrin
MLQVDEALATVLSVAADHAAPRAVLLHVALGLVLTEDRQTASTASR